MYGMELTVKKKRRIIYTRQIKNTKTITMNLILGLKIGLFSTAVSFLEENIVIDLQ